MKKFIHRLSLCSAAWLLGLLLCFPPGNTRADTEEVVIIVNPAVSDSVLTLDELQDIYLNKKTKWSDGKKIVFVTLKDPVTHPEFLKKYIQRTASQFRNFWKQQVFTGKGKMPTVFNSEEELLDFVSGTDGAIGYISGRVSTDSVKTIAVQ